jgi:TonB-linked SusC/RagA family outer membrane protein
VKDATGDPVIGANVLEKGTNNGTITDFEGNYTLTNVKANATLVFSYIGYVSQEIKVNGQTTINATIQEDSKNLEEVVVIGYGAVKKKDLTGSVASVSTSDLAKVAGANALSAMQAKVPGVDLTQSDGQAGSGISMKLRGTRSILANNDPLILVDGVEYGSTLDIPASEIESMDILKDAASTAIYGTKGANGVIIVTTKRGKAGSKTNVNFSAYLSFNSPTGVVKPMYGDKEVQRLVDAENYKTASQNGWDFSTGTATAQNLLGVAERNGINLYDDVIANGSYTDWLDIILQNSVSQNYEVNVNGGTAKTNFSIAMSYMNDKGMMKNDQFNRYTGRANIDHKINNIVKVGTSLSFTYKDNDKRNGNVYNQSLKMTTITHPYLADGTINYKPSYFYDAHCNPLLDEVDGAYQRNIETTRFFGSAYLQLNPIKNLTYKSNLTLDRSNSRDGLYQDMYSVGRYQTPQTSYISNSNSISTKLVWQNTATYNLDIEKNNFTFLLGSEASKTVKETSAISGEAGKDHYYQSAFYDVSKIASPTTVTSYVKSSMLSYFARVNYSFDSKYLLQASLRADGSSVLADGHKWGYFPSVSAGWRINEESFMAGTGSWLDNLKLRLSWGVSGNAAVDPYQTLATIKSIVPNSTSKAPMTLANKELTWETTSAFNIGVDFGFLNGRISGSAEYYISHTNDLLYYMTAPAASVYTSTLGNVGKTKGHGFELALNAVAVKTKDFTWDVNASLTLPHDEVVELYGGVDQVISGNSILKIGEPIQAYYQYQIENCWGIGEFDEYNTTKYNGEFVKPYAEYGNPGTLKVTDLNNDGTINADDRKVFRRTPTCIFGLSNTFSYQNFSLSVQMMARLGGYMDYAGYGLYTFDNSNWGDLDYWTPENTNTIIPNPGVSSAAGATYQNAVRMVKADFFKVKDITLAYNLDKDLLKRAYISNAKVYCSLKNFISTGKVDGYDSERGGAVTFPLAKQVVVGLNVTF